MLLAIKPRVDYTWGYLEFNGFRISLRYIFLYAGIVWWVLGLFLNTGINALWSLLDTVGAVLMLMVVTSFTRTLRFRWFSSVMFFGAFLVAPAVLIGMLLSATVGFGELRAIFQPMVEELAVMVPPLFLLWRWSRSIIWTIGATDVFTLFCLSGIGFGTLEEAYLRMYKWWGQPFIPLLPHSVHTSSLHYSDFIMNSHAVWAGLAGAGIGLALLSRANRPVAYGLAAAGISIGLLDHIALNYRAATLRDASWIRDLLTTITANGALAPCVLILAAITVMLVDYNICKRRMANDEPQENPLKQRSWPGWLFLLDSRSLYYAQHFEATCKGTWRETAARCADIMKDLRNKRIKAWNSHYAEKLSPAAEPAGKQE
jgi:hypothetical protein